MYIVYYSQKRCFDFAEKNPQAAIMDGAELLVHERILYGRKDAKILPATNTTTDHKPFEVPESELDVADNQPTEAIKQSSPPSNKEGK